MVIIKNDNVMIYAISIKINSMNMVMLLYKEKGTNVISIWKDPGMS